MNDKQNVKSKDLTPLSVFPDALTQFGHQLAIEHKIDINGNQDQFACQSQ